LFTTRFNKDWRGFGGSDLYPSSCQTPHEEQMRIFSTRVAFPVDGFPFDGWTRTLLGGEDGPVTIK
jgi:hypothetical protein